MLQVNLYSIQDLTCSFWKYRPEVSRAYTTVSRAGSVSVCAADWAVVLKVGQQNWTPAFRYLCRFKAKSFGRNLVSQDANWASSCAPDALGGSSSRRLQSGRPGCCILPAVHRNDHLLTSICLVLQNYTRRVQFIYFGWEWPMSWQQSVFVTQLIILLSWTSIIAYVYVVGLIDHLML